MLKLFLIIVCIVLGIIIQRFKTVPKNSYQTLNSLLVNIFMPCLIIEQISNFVFNAKYIFPILVAWIIFAIAFLFFYAIGKWKKINPKSVAVLIITGGISSTSFIGFPIFEMLYGKEGLQIGILMSQAGSFLIGITLGIAIASYYSSSTPSIKEMTIQIFKFPPLIAFIIALIINIAELKLPNAFVEILNKLSSSYLVIALISVGMQINFTFKNLENKLLQIGLMYKIMIAPLIIFLLYKYACHQSTMILNLSVMGAAIGPMNTSVFIADKFNLDSKLATHMVGYGMLFSFPILYFIYLFLN